MKNEIINYIKYCNGSEELISWVSHSKYLDQNKVKIDEYEHVIDYLTSDGYHTFKELYEHRMLLFIALMKAHPEISWRANNHEDGTMFEGGWFIAGMHLPTGDISYHLESSYWVLLDNVGIQTSNKAPKWDGHTSKDVVNRLFDYLNPEGGKETA